MSVYYRSALATFCVYTPLQCLLTFIAIYVLVAMILVFRRLRWRQLVSVWNCVDVMVVGLTWLSVVLFIVMMVHDARIVQSTHSALYAQSAACQNVWRCVNALLLLLLLIIVRHLLCCLDTYAYLVGLYSTAFIRTWILFLSKLRTWQSRGGSRSTDWRGHMASAEHVPIMGVWGLCPQRGPGAEPLVRGSGGEAPLKLNAFWCCYMSEMALNCYVY